MTPDYASPEQVRGERVTTATDVFSLGVILFELLTGDRPHRLDTYSPEDIEKAICRDEPRRPSALNRQLDSDLDNIVLMALRKEPQRRYASVEQLSEDVRRYLEGRPVRARRDTVRLSDDQVRASEQDRRMAAAAAIGTVSRAGSLAIRSQARRAEYRFQQVRKLAHSVLFDLNSEIENLAGSTKAREQLVSTSLGYLDSLAAEEGDDPALTLELAQAYEKIGDVQGDPKGRNLGHPEAAMKSYEKAISIAGRLDTSSSALELVASVYAKIGAVQRFALGRPDDGRVSLRRAVEVADSIPSKTGTPAFRVRVYVYAVLGDLDIEPHPERAIESYRRSLEIAREWSKAAPSLESRDFLCRAISRGAVASWNGGDLVGARDSYVAALQIADKLRQEEPGNAQWRMRRAYLTLQIGSITGDPERPNLGDPRSAEVWLQDALKDSESLGADEYDEWARYEQSEATGALARAVGVSEPARAEPLHRRALSLGDGLLEMSPRGCRRSRGAGGEEDRFRAGPPQARPKRGGARRASKGGGPPRRCPRPPRDGLLGPGSLRGRSA